MNRVIEFRTWDKYSNTMFYQNSNVGEDIIDNTESIVIGYDNRVYCLIENEHGDETIYYCGIDIEPMQYIGISDKNGKKIFEGDIVTVDMLIYSIQWKGCGFWFVDVEDDCFMFKPENYDIEIIGNIYEDLDIELK